MCPDLSGLKCAALAESVQKHVTRMAYKKKTMRRRRAPARKGGRVRRSYAKRSFRRTRGNRGRLQRSLTGFPRDNRATLLATTNEHFDMTVAGEEFAFFRCNSIYDPVGAVGGASAMNYPLWAGLYNHYMVTSATITAKFFVPALTTLPEAGAPYPVICYIRLNDDDTSTGPYTFANLAAGALTRYRLILPGTNPQIVTLHGVYNPKTFFQVKDLGDVQSRIGSPFGSNPVEQAFWQVGCATVDGTASNYDVQCLVSIRYNCYFTEPREQTIS